MPITPSRNIEIQEDGAFKGYTKTLNFTNSGLDVTITGSDAVISLVGVMLSDGSSPLTGNLDMGGFNAINSAVPVNPTDLVTKAYLDSNSAGFNPFLLMGS